MDNGEKEDATELRTSGVLQAGAQGQDVARAQRILLLERADSDFAFEHVDRDRPIGAMCGECSARPNRDHGEPKRPFLDQGPGTPAMPHEKCRVDESLILMQMMDANIAQRTV